MIPDWVLQIIFLVIGILGGGAIWYFLSLKMHYAALWIGFGTVVLITLVITILIRNSLINKEVKAKAPVYFGELIPGNDSTPPLPLEIPSKLSERSKDLMHVFLGNNLFVSTSSESYVLNYEGKPFLKIMIYNGLMRINTNVMDSTNRKLLVIIDNEFKVDKEGTFNPKQPNKHSLIVRDLEGIEVFNIHFINPKAMKITGRFYLKELSEPIIITSNEGIVLPNNSRVSNNIVMRNRFLNITRNGFQMGF